MSTTTTTRPASRARIRSRVITTALAATALLAPAVAGTSGAAAQPKGTGSAPTGCPLPDGSQAGFGETKAVIQDIRDSSGKLIKRIVDSYICGADGQWHYVLGLRATADITIVLPASATQVSR